MGNTLTPYTGRRTTLDTTKVYRNMGKNRWNQALRRKGMSARNISISLDNENVNNMRAADYIDVSILPIPMSQIYQTLGGTKHQRTPTNREGEPNRHITSEYTNAFRNMLGSFGWNPDVMYNVLSTMGYTWLPKYLLGMEIKKQDYDGLLSQIVVNPITLAYVVPEVMLPSTRTYLIWFTVMNALGYVSVQMLRKNTY